MVALVASSSRAEAEGVSLRTTRPFPRAAKLRERSGPSTARSEATPTSTGGLGAEPTRESSFVAGSRGLAIELAGPSERYVIEHKIATGGMATVYLGRDCDPSAGGRPVAIKVCHPHLLDREHRAEALLDEARIAAQIRHPNVVATLDVVFVPHDGSAMIVMEYVEGLTLADLLRIGRSTNRPGQQQRRIDIDVALTIITNVLAGLHAAHELRNAEGRELGVVHRDVSPQNILLSIDGVAKLADFGVSKGADRLAPSTETGELKGKLGYVPPEVYRGETITRRADIYAVGVVLWEMLAGRRLFEERTHAEVMHRVLASRIPSLTSIRDDVPHELDALLARALAVDPEDRYATAADFARAFARVPVVHIVPAHVLAAIVRSAMVDDHRPSQRQTQTQTQTQSQTQRFEQVRTPSGAAGSPRAQMRGALPVPASFPIVADERGALSGIAVAAHEHEHGAPPKASLRSPLGRMVITFGPWALAAIAILGMALRPASTERATATRVPHTASLVGAMNDETKRSRGASASTTTSSSSSHADTNRQVRSRSAAPTSPTTKPRTNATASSTFFDPPEL